MVTNALVDGKDAKIAMVYEVLHQWNMLYGPALGVALPDTFMSKSFYRHAPEWLFHQWRSNRHDSGSPFTFGDDLVIPAYQIRGIDPMTKMIIFSDGNSAQKMDEIERYFRGRIQPRFLQGTLFTNNFADLHPRADEFVPGLAPLTWRKVYKPFSLVCKAVEANGHPCVKLSDNIDKATGPKDEVARYVEIFGGEEHITQQVVV
jgi:nicotinate phosphoribosyltransferase